MVKYLYLYSSFIWTFISSLDFLRQQHHKKHIQKKKEAISIPNKWPEYIQHPTIYSRNSKVYHIPSVVSVLNSDLIRCYKTLSMHIMGDMSKTQMTTSWYADKALFWGKLLPCGLKITWEIINANKLWYHTVKAPQFVLFKLAEVSIV